MIFFNPDVDIRHLERAAAQGDPEAARQLFQHRWRAGVYAEAFRLFMESGGYLPAEMVVQLAREMLRYDLGALFKGPGAPRVPIWVAEREDGDMGTVFIGHYGARERAVMAAARDAIDRMNDVLFREDEDDRELLDRIGEAFVEGRYDDVINEVNEERSGRGESWVVHESWLE